MNLLIVYIIPTKINQNPKTGYGMVVNNRFKATSFFMCEVETRINTPQRNITIPKIVLFRYIKVLIISSIQLCSVYPKTNDNYKTSQSSLLLVD